MMSFGKTTKTKCRPFERMSGILLLKVNNYSNCTGINAGVFICQQMRRKTVWTYLKTEVRPRKKA